MADILKYNEKIFEEIKNINDYEQEFWYARELAEILEYTKWGNFKKVIDKAKEACNNSDINVLNHFADVGKMIDLAKGAKREIEDMMLSRYACYLIVQNADSRKNVVALGQTYFAAQTIKQVSKHKLPVSVMTSEVEVKIGSFYFVESITSEVKSLIIFQVLLG